ncbi:MULTISPECIES: TetR/AcrR family transcriptional regulator [Actinoplanes]|uniref:TetR/AcrR family transcriptional regulator n=1 Tax=Actinoplanes TaxID=1865 RepID=UPI0005F2B8DD|nr:MULTISPECIES: TetR/AcrR family transcriptional regulator [Actinoplanes]GLY07920.1 TetR family transcriptional regulator [Actinoplanes sp. NBRC 101535]
MRADARKNYDQLLAIASTVVAEGGADASLRDIARRAGVGLGTLYRHFPTREALLEALLRTGFDALTAKAADLEAASAPGEALRVWLRDFIANATTYRGVTTVMMAAIEDPDSALHASCVAMRAAGARLLARAQADGAARADIDGTDVYALAGSLAWIADQPGFASRVDRLVGVVTGAILTA